MATTGADCARVQSYAILRGPMAHRKKWGALVVLMAALTSCAANPGEYVWVQQYPGQGAGRQNEADYLIGTGDSLTVRVYEQESITTRARVRADGKISVALVGDVAVAGKRPSEVAAEVALKLKQYIKDPSVTVILEEVRPISVAVIGEVAHPGLFQLDGSSGVLEALAAAGGPTDFADRDLVFVIRRRTSPQRIRFTYKALLRGDPSSMAFTLRAGDTVVVE